MPSSTPRADLRLLGGDPECRWRLTISGSHSDARLSAVYRAGCGGVLELVFHPLTLREHPRRIRLATTPGTVFEARAERLSNVDEAAVAGRELMARLMGGSLETLAPDAPCRHVGRRRRRPSV